MKKFVAVLLAFALIFSLTACKNGKETENETTTAVAETTTEPEVTKEELLQKAREAYAAFIVQKISEVPDPEGSPDSAFVVDLDGNGIPEVVCRSGDYNETYILSYGENDGLNVIIPQKHSDTFENIYFSKGSGLLYYTDCGHNQDTAWYHEGVCLEANAEGLQVIGTLTGDPWDDAPNNIYNNEKLFNEYKTKYDNEFDDSMKKLIGDGNFTEYDEVCVKENVWKYLSEELSINLTEKKAEYDEFKAKATAAVGEDNLVALHIGDYDRNGTFEAFAFVGQENDPKKTEILYEGNVLFVDNDGNIETIIECENGYRNNGTILNCQYHDYYQIIRYDDGQSLAFFAAVFDGKCSVISDFFDAGLNGFEMGQSSGTLNSPFALHNAYDADLERVEHTCKPYFYYDTPDGLHEYGGVEISSEQFEKLGGKKYMEKYAEMNYTIENIYLRGNGIINVNLTKTYNEPPFEGYHCAIYKITNHSLKPMTEWLVFPNEITSGHYSPAATPNLAVYPELADFGL